MTKKMICALLCIALLISYIPTSVSAAGLTVDVPIAADLTGATGVDLNIRLDPNWVESAAILSVSDGLRDTTYLGNQDGNKFKVAIASAAPFSNSGTLLTLRLTLKCQAPANAELCKLLQIKVNERITWQADNCILLAGAENGKYYREPVTIHFNEGTALLDGKTFSNGSTVSAEGSHTLAVTDLNGKTRTIRFTIDTVAPVITVSSYSTEPSDQPLTVTASTNEGTLNATSHTFTQNGSFTFTAEDAAGNRSTKTVTVSHLYKDCTLTLLNIPDDLTLIEGTKLNISGWKAKISYDNGMERTVSVTEDMLQYSTASVGSATGTVTCGKASAQFRFTVTAKQLVCVAVKNKPEKIYYIQGESLDSKGMELTLSYNNGTTETVRSGWQLSGYDPNKLGQQTITVTYRGKTATFTVTVASAAPSTITSDKYSVSGGWIRKISAGTSVSNLVNGINEKGYIKVFSGGKEVSGSTLVGTGMEVRLMDGNTIKAAVTVVVTGDTNGDGKATVTDMIAVKSHVLKKSTLSGASAQAADTSADGGISITDFIQIKASILGKGTITPN